MALGSPSAIRQAARRGIPELLELVQRLPSEVVAVDQEEDAPGPGVLDQAVAGRHRQALLPQ